MRTKLEKVMKEKNITRYELFKATGIPESTIWRITTGRTKRPQRTTMRMLAKAMGVEVGAIS